jgi:hypothetical protein
MIIYFMLLFELIFNFISTLHSCFVQNANNHQSDTLNMIDTVPQLRLGTYKNSALPF